MDTTNNSIDIRIPDSAVMQVYKLKKTNCLKSGAETLDNSELQSCAKQRKVKRIRRNSGSDIPQRKPRKPKQSYKSQHLKSASNHNPVNTSTLDSLCGLLGAKVIQEKDSLTSLENAFPVVNHDTPQTLQNNIYEHVSLVENKMYFVN